MLSLFVAAGLVYISVMFVGKLADGRFMDWINWIQRKTRMSDAVAGETIQALGTSAPEIAISFLGLYLLSVHPTVGLATILGSAIFNLTVVIGWPLYHAKQAIQLEPKAVIRSLMTYAGCVGLLLLFISDGQIIFGETVILAVYHILLTILVIALDGDHESEHVEEAADTSIFARVANLFPAPDGLLGIFGFLIVLLGIGFGCYLMIGGTQYIGTGVGISMTFLSLTVLAAGSSAPELFTNIYLMKRGKGNQAIGNAVGSNTLDICIAFALVAIPYTFFQPIIVSDGVKAQVMASATLLFVYLAALLLIFLLSAWKIRKGHGHILNLMFIAFVAFMLLLER